MGTVIVTPSTTGAMQLKRSYKMRDLVLFGLVFMNPLAGIMLFGLSTQISRGHMILTYLIAFGAMLFTAYSYGKMVEAYPVAGSTYTYAKRIHPGMGLPVWMADAAGLCLHSGHLLPDCGKLQQCAHSSHSDLGVGMLVYRHCDDDQSGWQRDGHQGECDHNGRHDHRAGCFYPYGGLLHDTQRLNRIDPSNSAVQP